MLNSRPEWSFYEKNMKTYILFSLLLTLLSTSRAWAVEKLSYEVIASYTHDSKAWTQGLFYEDGKLYESTGLYEESTLRRVDLKTGKVLQKHVLDGKYFAEGMTIFQGKLYQLTWRAGIGFIYDSESFIQSGEFHYTGEGWGLTHNASQLIMSDGSDTIRFIDPETLKTVRRIAVKLGSKQVKNLNELEFVDGYIYANIWYQNAIVKIDPATGQIVGVLDLSKLTLARSRSEGAVLNGIAYNHVDKVFYVTGKLWEELFVIKLPEQGVSL